jgi:hypothetical protein
MIWAIDLPIFLGTFFGVYLIMVPWQYRSYRSMLEVSIPAIYAVRGDPSSGLSREFGIGRLNCAGRPFPVSLSVDGGFVYLVPQPHWFVHFGAPSYFFPRSNVRGVKEGDAAVTIELDTAAITFRGYRGYPPDVALRLGPAQIDREVLASLIDSDQSHGFLHQAHHFNPLRVLAGLLLLFFGVSAALTGHWGILIGFAIGGVFVLGLLGRWLAHGMTNPAFQTRRSELSGLTLAIAGMTSVAPTAIGGVVLLVLFPGQVLFQILAGLALSIAFSILALYLGIGMTSARVRPSL